MIPLSLSLNLLLLVAKYSSYLPFSKIYVPIPNLIFFAFYYIFFICIGWDKLKEFRKKIANKIRIQKVKLFSLFLILIVILGIIHISPNDLKVYFIDVGQGDCSLVISPYGKKILIDGGGSKEVSNFDVGENTILPFLLHKGVTNIDIVMISHFDADHCNGLISILESINVKKVVISKQASISEEYLKFVNIIKERKIPVQIVKRGDKINIDKQSYFEILHPAEELMDDQKGGLNINSIVAKLVYKTSKEKFRTLFTGDIEEKGEQELLNKEIELQSEVLKVGHHGSKSSTTENFLDKVNPKIALIGVGEKNTFGHPSSVVIERLTRRKIRIYRTDINGEIKMSINKKRKDSYR